ncbi:hypothetical protein DUNSADRAFT_13897 [Dunaliella salina]|uniref:Helicase-associated domain-containing protein n=1 Tax=Dunaliella salina TaxID=3046 RepID=A0ABQ7G8H6_DUNSA|nr:hypothetical protein DUNSADRAFT_13897 [Dunaliella salina]|eukprot:KAF5830908.1 hypothetical protein DUNSADRAFT_13897 [Dunaliella salina]
MYQQLALWQAQHCSCHVPRHCFDAPPLLDAWVRHLRRKYASGRLEQWKVDRLNLLGFEWSMGDVEAKWVNMYHQLRRFKAVHGHTNVPQNYRNSAEPGWEILARWLRRQAQLLAKAKLSQQQLEMLSRVGVVLEVPAHQVEQYTQLQGLNAHERKKLRRTWRDERRRSSSEAQPPLPPSLQQHHHHQEQVQQQSHKHMWPQRKQQQQQQEQVQQQNHQHMRRHHYRHQQQQRERAQQQNHQHTWRQQQQQQHPQQQPSAQIPRTTKRHRLPSTESLSPAKPHARHHQRNPPTGSSSPANPAALPSSPAQPPPPVAPAETGPKAEPESPTSQGNQPAAVGRQASSSSGGQTVAVKRVAVGSLKQAHLASSPRQPKQWRLAGRLRASTPQKGRCW